MKIEIKDIVNVAGLNGKKYFVCDYRKDTTQKAIRHIKPTEIILQDEDDYNRAGKKYPRVHYSRYAFVQMNQKGEPVYSKNISPFDNTGWRSYTGVGLNIFDNLQECIDHYNSQVKAVVELYEKQISTIVVSLTNEMEEIKKLTIKGDE